MLELLADGRRPPLRAVVEVSPQFFDVHFLVLERALGACQIALLSGEPLFSLIQSLLLAPEPRFVGLPSFGEFGAESIARFIELRQHLLPFPGETCLGVDLALADIGFPIMERLFPLGGFVIALVQSGALFCQFALPRFEIFGESGDRLLLLTQLRCAGIQLLIVGLVSLPHLLVHVASIPGPSPTGFRYQRLRVSVHLRPAVGPNSPLGQWSTPVRVRP